MRRVRGMWVGGTVAMAVAIALAATAWHDSGCGSLRRLARIAMPGTALAQEVLEFKPLSPESAAAIDKRTSDKIQRLTDRARRQAEIDAKAQGIPSPPAVPETPEPPAGRSGDIMRLGSDIEIEKGQTVDGDVVSIGGDVEIFGHVRGDAASMGGDLHLGPDARVDGDVVCIGGKLEEDAGSSVGGQRVTALGVMRGSGSKRIVIDRDDDSDGVHTYADKAIEHTGEAFAAMVFLLVMLGFAWIYANFAAERSAVAFTTAKRETGMSLLVGFITALLLAPSAVALALVAAILCITIIGIPLGVAAIFAYGAILAIACTWGFVIGAGVLGERLGARSGTARSFMRSAAIGLIAIQGLQVAGQMFGLIPFFGWVGGLLGFAAFVAGSVVILIGVGALIRSKVGQGPDGKWWPLHKRVVPVAPSGAAAGGPQAAPAPGVATPPAPSAPAPPTTTSFGSAPASSFAPAPQTPPATEPEQPGPGSLV